MRRLVETVRSRLLHGQSTFKRGFVSTFGLNMTARGLSAIAIVMLVRGLEVGDFAYVVLLLTVGSFAGSFAAGGIRMRYTREEAERVSRGLDEPSPFLTAVGGTAAQIAAAAALGCSARRSSASATPLRSPDLHRPGGALHARARVHGARHVPLPSPPRVHEGRALRRPARCFDLRGRDRSHDRLDQLRAGGDALDRARHPGRRRRRLRAARMGDSAGPLPRRGRWAFGAESNWLTLYFIASAGFAYGSMFMVATLLDDSAVASFGAAERYVSIVLGPVWALMTVLRVRTSQQDVVDSHSAQLSMLVRWMKRASLPTAAVVGAMAALAPFVIPLIDDGRYPDSVTIFQLLMIDAFFVYVTMPAPNLLMAQRRYRLLAVLYSVFLAVQVAVTVVVGTTWGVIGIAVVAAVFGVVSRTALVGATLWSGTPGAKVREPEKLREPALIAD